MMELAAKEFAIQKHQETNHLYGGYLPYQFHLEMVVREAREFYHNSYNNYLVTYLNCDTLFSACWLHDVMEDCRVTYNDLSRFGDNIRDIVYAVTNEKGKNRAERANDKYYEGIRAVPLAPLVKICDRIANVKYSKMIGSSMFEKYKREHDNFIMKVVPVKDEKDYENLIKTMESFF